MSNANFEVGFELKELKVGKIVTFCINYHIFFIFERQKLRIGHEIRTTRLDDLYLLFCDLSIGVIHFCEK